MSHWMSWGGGDTGGDDSLAAEVKKHHGKASIRPPAFVSAAEFRRSIDQQVKEKERRRAEEKKRAHHEFLAAQKQLLEEEQAEKNAEALRRRQHRVALRRNLDAQVAEHRARRARVNKRTSHTVDNVSQWRIQQRMAENMLQQQPQQRRSTRDDIKAAPVPLGTDNTDELSALVAQQDARRNQHRQALASTALASPYQAARADKYSTHSWTPYGTQAKKNLAAKSNEESELKSRAELRLQQRKITSHIRSALQCQVKEKQRRKEQERRKDYEYAERIRKQVEEEERRERQEKLAARQKNMHYAHLVQEQMKKHSSNRQRRTSLW